MLQLDVLLLETKTVSGLHVFLVRYYVLQET